MRFPRSMISSISITLVLIFACAATPQAPAKNIEDRFDLEGSPLSALKNKFKHVSKSKRWERIEKFNKNPSFELTREADAAAAEGEFDHAIGLYTNVIRNDSKFAPAYLGRGLTYRAVGENQSALKDLSSVIRLSPELSTDAYRPRAQVLKSMHQYQKAIEDYNTMIKLGSKSSGVYEERAEVYMLLNKPNEAMKDLDEGLRLKPSSSVIRRTRVDALVQAHRYEDAVRELTALIKIEEDSSPDIRGTSHYYQLRAQCYRALGKKELALQDDKASKANDNQVLEQAPFRLKHK